MKDPFLFVRAGRIEWRGADPDCGPPAAYGLGPQFRDDPETRFTERFNPDGSVDAMADARNCTATDLLYLLAITRVGHSDGDEYDAVSEEYYPGGRLDTIVHTGDNERGTPEPTPAPR